MSKYIEADAFLAYETKRCNGSMPYVGCCTTTNNYLKNELERFPAADVVEVVRCKDCKFSQENDGKLIHGARYCENEEILGYGNYMSVWDSNYCSHGARMDGEADGS